MSDTKHGVTQHPRQNCYFCGSEGPIETHHIVPRRHDGSDDECNLVDLCPTCHQRLERLYDKRFYQKIAVAKTADPVVSYDLQAAKEGIIENLGNGVTRNEMVDMFTWYGFDYTEKEAKLVIDDLVDRGLLAENGDKLSPLFDLSDSSEEGGYEPPQNREGIKNTKDYIYLIESENDGFAPIDELLDQLNNTDNVTDSEQEFRQNVRKLRSKGEVYEPEEGYLKTT